jgi:purine-binding chemotaxis protein CheW
MPLSMPPTDSQRTGDLRNLLTFRLSSMSFAVAVEHVVRVAEVGAITPLPRAPSHVPGMVMIGSRAVPLLDLGRFLGIENDERGSTEELPRLVVISADGLEVALRCSSVRVEREVSNERLREPESIQGERLKRFTIAEIDEQHAVVAVLDVPRLLTAAQPGT